MATMILRLFSPHGHGQCKAMRYISKHEADVYLDKEEKTQRTEKKAWTPALSSNVKLGLHYNGANSRFLHNAVGWSYICFAFLYSSLKIQRQRLSPQMDKNKETDDNLKQSPCENSEQKNILHT